MSILNPEELIAGGLNIASDTWAVQRGLLPAYILPVVKTYGPKVNYPAANSDPILSYIHPTAYPTGSFPSNYSAQGQVYDLVDWPSKQRIIGEAPTPAQSVAPSTGVWWFAQDRFHCDAGQVSTIGSLNCKFKNQRMTNDEGNWNRLIEVFLAPSITGDVSTRTAEIGYICSSPQSTKDWFNNSGTVIGSGLTDRYGRTWKCRKMTGSYYVFLPLEEDFYEGQVDLADAFQYLLSLGEILQTQYIHGNYLYYDLEAVPPGGIVDVYTESLSFEYSQKVPDYIWDGMINGNSGFIRTIWNPGQLIWDDSTKELVWSRDSSETYAGNRTLFKLPSSLISGQQYKVAITSTMTGTSPISAGITIGVSVDSSVGAGQSSTVTMSTALTNGYYTFTALSGQNYLVVNCGKTAGNDQKWRLSRLGIVESV